MNFNKHKKKYGFVVFGVPTISPLVLFLFNFDISPLDHFFFENIRIFQRVFEGKNNNEALISGYIASIFYLMLILPWMIKRSRKTLYFGVENRKKIKTTWLGLAIYLFALFIFLNFFDYSSVSSKLLGMIDLSFYFWPLFYFYFLFPLYLSSMLLIAFMNTEIK